MLKKIFETNVKIVTFSVKIDWLAGKHTVNN
jgi:hypothetical protein